jgi:hypothetical protein
MQLRHVVVPRKASEDMEETDDTTTISTKGDGSAISKKAEKKATRKQFKSKETKALYGHYDEYPACRATVTEREKVAGLIACHMPDDLLIWAESTTIPGTDPPEVLADCGYALFRALLNKYEGCSDSNKALLLNQLLGGLQMTSDTVVSFDAMVSEMKSLFRQLKSLDFQLEDLSTIILEAGMPSDYKGCINSAMMMGLEYEDMLSKVRDAVARSDRGAVVSKFTTKASPEKNKSGKCGYCNIPGHGDDECYRNPNGAGYKGAEWNQRRIENAKRRVDFQGAKGNAIVGKHDDDDEEALYQAMLDCVMES